MPDDEGNYHEYEELVTCQECGNDEAGCECEEGEEDLQDMGVCAVCEEYEDEPIHVEA